jgi:hypothetical protein
VAKNKICESTDEPFGKTPNKKCEDWADFSDGAVCASLQQFGFFVQPNLKGDQVENIDLVFNRPHFRGR